jgi:hypothetical protein
VARCTAILGDPDAPIPYEQAKADLAAARRELLDAETALPTNGAPPPPNRADINALAREFAAAFADIRTFINRRGVIERFVDKIRWDGDRRVAEIHCRVPRAAANNCNRREHVNCSSSDHYSFVINARLAA